MSNLRNTTRLPLRSSMTNKGKAHTSTNDLLERKTRTLEGSLNKLKLTMQRDQNKPTMDIYRRGKSIPAYSREKPTGIKSITKCGQCENEDAKMRCLECVEVYCTNCYSQFHLRGALQRHHCVLLPAYPKKTPTTNSDTQLPESNTKESGEIPSSQADIATFQQSFLQWREENINKSKRNQQKRGITSPTQNRIDYSNKLPYLDSIPPQAPSDDNALLKKSQTTANQQIFNQRSTKRDEPKINVRVRIHHSFSDHKNLADIIEPLNDISTPRSTELMPVGENSSREHDLAQIEEQDRPYTHISTKSISRPTSLLIKKDFVPLQSNPIVLSEQPIRSDLAAKSNDELEAILNTKLNLSRASSACSENLDEPTSWRPSKSTSNNINAQSVVIDQNALAQFDSALDELFDESKIELAYQLDSAKGQPSGRVFDINSNTVTPRRHSPFSFSNSLYKMSRINSASSRDTGEGGFFTDVSTRHPIPVTPPPVLQPPILECSTSNEWKNTSENQPAEPNAIPLPKLSIPSLLRSASKHSIKQEETNPKPKSPIENDSRPGSSLSSSSLPISVTSSKPGFGNAKAQSSTTSSRKSSLSTTDNSSSSSSAAKNTTSTTAKDTSSSSTTLKDTSSSSTTTAKDTSTSSSSSEMKTSSAPTTTSNNETTTSATSTTTTKTPFREPSKPTLENSSSKLEPMVTKNEKDSVSAPDEYHQESAHSLNDKSSYQAQMSEETNESSEPATANHLTRGANITEKDLPIKKKVRRPIPTNDDSSQYRKLEFSVGDGLKWQEASMESLSSTKTIVSKRSTPHSFTPSNPINTELAEQFTKYDNDDGRSSAADQNLNDEECFNQLCEELCSELNNKGSDEEVLLNEHILKILQNVRRPFQEQDLPLYEPKLSDNEVLIHD